AELSAPTGTSALPKSNRFAETPAGKIEALSNRLGSGLPVVIARRFLDRRPRQKSQAISHKNAGGIYLGGLVFIRMEYCFPVIGEPAQRHGGYAAIEERMGIGVGVGDRDLVERYLQTLRLGRHLSRQLH